MSNNIEEDIETVEGTVRNYNITGEFENPNYDDLGSIVTAMSNVVNNCKKNKKIVDEIRGKINERQFELQQEYKEFKDDIRLNTLQEIYYMFKEE